MLDGKQRLLTIKEFLDGTFSDGKKFTLKGLRLLTALEGKSWEEIVELKDWSDQFFHSTLRTAVLRNVASEDALYEIFYRLNSGSVRLSPMELRMSLHPGDFLKFIVSWTEEKKSVHTLLGKSGPDPRMNDVELAVRHLAFIRGEIAYAGDLKKFLDETCEMLNTEFVSKNVRKAVEEQLNEMSLAIDVGLEAMGRHFS